MHRSDRIYIPPSRRPGMRPLLDSGSHRNHGWKVVWVLAIIIAALLVAYHALPGH